MVSLDRGWWEHLAPKPMHGRFREVETLLRNWCRTDYGSMWRDAASSRGGAIRVRPGQAVPTFHVILIKDRPAFVAPQARVREGHRVVATFTDQWRSGRPLEEGELALWPEIRVEMVDDPALIAAAKPNPALHVFGVRDPALLFTVPANLLLAPTSWVKKSFVLYQHIFGDGRSWPNDGFFYVGVTTRSWQKRWVEHRRAMESGSPLLFHRKLREEMSAGRVTYVNHKVMGITEDLEQLYATEEMLVAGHWNDDRRLNMIPGGKSGLKYLRENGMLPDRTVPMPDDRDRLVEAWLREHPRKGLPAPWVSEKWKDEAWAIAQICGRDGRLSVEQVRAIRELAAHHSPDIIAQRIGALNKEQVQRVIDGETYVRVV